MTTTELKPCKTIIVQGKRWFQRTYGNTYHSVTIIVDGDYIEGVDFAYGYGDQYLESAVGKLEDAGFILRERYGGHESLWQCCERLGIKLRYSVTDVARKKDL